MIKEEHTEFDIAVIGMACRFPGADNPHKFWENLISGVESIRKLTDEEIIESGVDPSYLKNPAYIKSAPVLDEPGFFDASFFGFTPAEALSLDPQHRILLTCAYEALENAGYDPEKFKGRIGVYTGTAMNSYLLNSGLNKKFTDEYIPTLIGNDKDFVSTRISYKLNLKGPSINIQTACSTSLVAVHLACQSLLNEETDMVIAGAASVKAPHNAGYIYDGGGIVSPDGHVRAFDAKANGTVFGSGAGIVILKRLSDAIKDRDNILAVIKGSAVNNDGSDKVGYTAPGVKSQAEVVIEAILNSGINSESINYVETHGSGTPVGDPIEIAALTRAFKYFTGKKNYCPVGSVKTNIGHLDAAAGIAGIIKTILSLKNKKIPPSLNFSKPNPEIDFSNSPFFVNSSLKDWESGKKRIALVMSTGMGGTNACVVMEEAPEINSDQSVDYSLFILSAKDEKTINDQTNLLLNFLAGSNNTNLKDIAYTLQNGRKEFDCRRFFVVKNKNEASGILKQVNSRKIFTNRISVEARRPVIFMFPGIGDQYVGMGYDLYQKFRVFRDEIDNCAAILNDFLGYDIRKIIYPDDFNKKQENNEGIDLRKMLAGGINDVNDENSQELNKTINAQPALFIIEYALAKLWMHFGVMPDAIIGHSMGEYVGACLSGVLSLKDALYLIAKRAALVNKLPAGSMLAVNLPEKELLPLLNEEISISLINSPNLCVVAGSEDNISKFKNVLNEKGILYRPVKNGHAFHSKLMEPVFNILADEVSRMKLNSPGIPYTSNVTGNWITASQAVDPRYWAKHIVSTARFSDSIEKVWDIKNCILLEVGPGNTLAVLAMQHPERIRNEFPAAISSLRPVYDNQSDIKYLLTNIGKLWLAGIKIEWDNLYENNSKPRRVALPTYPFQYKNFWLVNSKSEMSNGEKEPPGKIRRNNFNDWFYIPGWKRKNLNPYNDNITDFSPGTLWMIFAGKSEPGDTIKSFLKNTSNEVIKVIFNKDYSKISPNEYTVDAQNPEHYSSLFGEIKSLNPKYLNIIHLGCFTGWNIQQSDYKDESLKYHGFYSLLFIARSLNKLNISLPVNIEIVSNHIQQVTGEENLSPLKGLILGPCGVIPKEYSNVKTFNIDLESENFTNFPGSLIRNLLAEFETTKPGENIAYRGRFKWVKSYDKIGPADTPVNTRTRIKEKGVYFITGGTGGIGLTIAKYLAENFQAKIVLTQKSEIPGKSEWRNIVNRNHIDNKLNQKLMKLIELEDSGAQIMVFTASVSDEIKMREVFKETERIFGKINGIIHCAGIVQAGIIQAKKKESIESVLAPKVTGTLVLNEIIKEMELDFFVLCSSITSIITPYAESDYSAANAFMDVYSLRSVSENKFCTLSINWPGWKEVGQLNNLEVLKGTEMWKASALEKAISPHEGLEVFKLAINSDLAQIIVSPEPLNDYLQYNSETYFSRTAQKKVKNEEEIESNVYIDKGEDEIDKGLMVIWKDILGVKSVNMEDNFLESGGHSLLAIQLISSIRKSFAVDLSIEDIFDALTFSGIRNKICEIVSSGKFIKQT